MGWGEGGRGHSVFFVLLCKLLFSGESLVYARKLKGSRRGIDSTARPSACLSSADVPSANNRL